MEIIIPSVFDGVLLRTYLRGTLKISDGILTSLKEEENGITVNGTRVTVRYVLHTDDILRLDFPAEEASDIEPLDIPLNIIFEDDDVLAVNKPSGMPTHPSHGHHDDTLANAVAYYYKGKGFAFRPVNRLDRATSGIVLIAKTRLSASVLSKSFKSGDVGKTYAALCHGELPCTEGSIDKNIKRANDSIIFRQVCESHEGQNALTFYKTVTTAEYNGDIISYVKLYPKTGRTHQLRVHTAFCGCPILCDGLYGDGFTGGLERLALHALSLSFPLPSTGVTVTLNTVVPLEWRSISEDFK